MKTWKLNLNKSYKYLALTSIFFTRVCFANEFASKVLNIKGNLLNIGAAGAGLGVIIGLLFVICGLPHIGSPIAKSSALGVILFYMFDPIIRTLQNIGG